MTKQQKTLFIKKALLILQDINDGAMASLEYDIAQLINILCKEKTIDYDFIRINLDNNAIK